MDSGESGGGGGGGGGGAGGKIRTRRYHLAGASSKPYPKNKQGIINIVKESVKSIVPTWLQRYFRQNEEASPSEQRSQEENVNYHPAFADDIADNNLEIDGRITPEPTRIISEEPSTSRSGLNFTDILTRPSLHRSHLNCNILDSPPPLCQPSTSSAFPISNSGLSLGKEMKDSTSQHDDDNISTTSGFSSRASDKDIAVSKSASVPPLWSMEAERPVALSQHTTTSSKKPGFNLSAFGALSPSLGNASVLKTNQLGNSPFYPGKTTYGGAAAAARQSKARIIPYQTPIRRQMKAKQVNAQSYGVTSSTARRILQSLEKMSSPLADAKRIPSVSSPLSSPMERSMSNITDFHSPRRKAESHSPPVQKLVTPKAVSLSMSRSQYFKPSLTSATESSRIRQKVEVNHRGVKEKNLAVEQQIEPSERYVKSIPDLKKLSVTKPKFSTTSSNGLPHTAGGGSSGGGGGKMRRERGVHYVSKSAQEEEEMEIPVLPQISLPISTSSLPNFSFGSLASTTASSSPVSAAQSVANKVQPASNSSSPVFRFSSPIVKSTEAEVLPPVSSIGGFKFSVPVAKSSEPSGPKDTPVLPLVNAAVNSISNKRENEYDGPFKPAKVLKEGSVLDILKSPGFASPTMYSTAATPPVATSTVVYTRPAISSFSGTSSGFADTSKQVSTYWQCDTCLVQNKLADNKCIACQASKVPTSDGTKQTGILTQNITIKSVVSSTGTQGFADKFKPASGTWDCDTCLVQNKPEVTKCVACETPKPGTGVKPALVFPIVAENATTVSSSSSYTDVTVNLGFGDKFKKPKGAWDCSVCLVSNKAEDSKCVACQSDKPGGSVPVVSSSASSSPALSGGFLSLDKFKKPEGSWDCEICLVQNKADATKCVACENAKPGSKTELKGFAAAASSSASSAPTFKFGIQSSSESQMLGSAGKNFKFGEQGGFKFGIGSELGSTTNTMAGGFKFSVNEGSKVGGFLSESKSEDNVKDGKTNSSFNFGLPSGATSMSTTSFQFGIANLGQQEKKEGLSKTPGVGSFTFGTNSTATSENKTGISSFGNAEEKEAAVTPFSFKKPEEKKDENSSANTGFTFGNVESKTAPQLVLGRTDEKQESVAPSNPLVFGKRTESEESKAQPIFSFGKAEQAKDHSTVKPAFSFSLAKPAERETEQQSKPAFTFGAQANTADPETAKSAFSFLSSSSSNAAVPSVSAGSGSGSSSLFSSTTSASNPPPGAPTFLFGQASNTVSSTPFGNSSDSNTSQSFGFSQESKPPTTTSTTNADFPFLFCPVTTTYSTANTGFSFATASTTTAPSTGSSSSFVFGSGSSAPAAGPAFGASQTPTFGQSQGSSQAPAPTFRSFSSSSLFSAGSQPGPPAFGSVSSNAQPAVFGQQTAQQPGFGSGAAPNSGSAFQFGSSTANFNFTGNSPGVFTFGANPGAQPTGSSGFSFTQPSSFNPGNNGKNIFSTSGSSLSTRKIKTAVRRRK